MNRRRRRGAATAVHPCRVEDLVPPNWTEQQRADFEAAILRAKTKVNVAVTGVTGSGKSALINALCGAVPKENVEYDEEGKVVESELYAKEGEELSHSTREVACYLAQKASLSDRLYTITVWDSPGLEDGTGNGVAYVQQLQRECGGDIDILLYCVNVSVTKCIVEDMVPGIKVVTETIGPDIWRHTMVVLTFANELEQKIKKASLYEDLGESTDHIFALRLDHWEKKVVEALIKAGVPESVARNVPVEPAGDYTEPSLPDRPHWLGYLWLQFLSCARDEAKLAIIINNQHRIRDAKHLSPIELLQCQTEAIPIVLDRDCVGNVIKVGVGVGAGMAALTGACVGGALGGVFLGTLTAGVGAGVGLAAGAAVGSMVGPLVAVAVNKTLQKRQEKPQRSDSVS